MPLKVKTAEQAGEKYDARARVAVDDYAREAAASGDVWASNTQAAKENYRSAISAAGIADRFLGGVRRAGAAKYVRKIEAVARDRYAPGISAGLTDYKERTEPFLATLRALVLPPRKPRGDPGNLQRVDAANKALHAKRLALMGVGGAGA